MSEGWVIIQDFTLDPSTAYYQLKFLFVVFFHKFFYEGREFFLSREDLMDKLARGENLV
jgi:hypothetical protein